MQGLAANLVQDPAGAEDVAQDTMLAALAGPPRRLDDVRSLRAWLRRVATNLANLARRRSARRRRREEVVARPEAVSSAAEAVEHASQLRRVVEAVLELDEPYRSTVLLRYFDGLTTEQIARRTAATPVATRKRLSRGVERLRQRLDEESGGNRRAWIAAMLPFARRSIPRIPSPGSALPPWLVCARAATVGLAFLTLAALSALVTLSLRPEVEAATPVSDEPELAESLREPVPFQEVVPWDLPYQRAERGELMQLEPGERVVPEPRRERRPVPAGELRIAGRVVDLEGYGLPGLGLVAAGSPETILATTGRGGSFAFTTTARDFSLVAVGPGYATLRSSPVRAAQPRRTHVLLAERDLDLVGAVLNEEGAPLEGAVTELVVPDSVYLAVPVPIECSRLVERSARTDELGVFRLGGVVARAEILVRTRLEGYEEDRRSVLADDLTIRLRRPASPSLVLEGLVQLPDGRPAPDAEVRIGRVATRTSRAGRFSLPFDARLGGELVAHAQGWPPVVDQLPGGAGGAASGPPPFHRVRLEGELLALGGLLTGAGERALSGWVVTAADEAGDPRYPDVPPGAPVRWTTTGPDGSFLLEGLLAREYTLRALDPIALDSLEPTRVAAGRRDLRLNAGGQAAQPEQGQVVDREGRPLPFAYLTRVLATGGGSEVAGPMVVADASGRFRLPGRTSGAASLRVQHTQVIGARFGGGGVVVVPRDAWFRYVGGSWPVEPDSLEVHDGAGVALTLHGPTRSGTSMPLFGGRSPVLRVNENGRRLVLLRGGRRVGQMALQLVPGEVIVVGGPWAGAGLGAGRGQNTGNPVTPQGSRQP